MSNMMEQKKARMKISEMLFYIFLILMFLTKGIGLYDGQILYKLIFMAAMLCIVFKLALSEHTIVEWIFIVVMGILAVMINRHSGEKGVLICYAVIVGMHDIQLKNVMKIGAWIYGISLFAMVTYYGIFLDQSLCMTGTRMGVAAVPRYGMGYPHPNTFHVTYLAACALIIYCLGKKFNWKHTILLLAGNLYVFLYSMSYTATFTTGMLILLTWYIVNRKELSTIEYGIAALALPVVLFISVFAQYILPDTIMEFLKENLFTIYHRLELAASNVRKENISLLGTQLSEVTTSQFSLDNSFLYCLVFCGVLFFVFMVLLYIYLMYRLIKEKRDFELLITCVFLVQAIMEPFLFNTSFKNVTLFFAGSVLWERKTLCVGNGLLSKKIRIVPDKEIFFDNSWLTEMLGKIRNCWMENQKSSLFTVGVGSGAVFILYAIMNPINVKGLVGVMEYLRGLCGVVWATALVVGAGNMIVRFIKYQRK